MKLYRLRNKRTKEMRLADTHSGGPAFIYPSFNTSLSNNEAIVYKTPRRMFKEWEEIGIAGDLSIKQHKKRIIIDLDTEDNANKCLCKLIALKQLMDRGFRFQKCGYHSALFERCCGARDVYTIQTAQESQECAQNIDILTKND